MNVDLIIENATLHTVDSERPIARKLAVWNGQILALDEDCDGLEARETLDLGGATVLPGFIDGHTHLGTTGLMDLTLDLTGARDRRDMLDQIAAAAATVGLDDWVDVVGYDQRCLDEVHLTATELDAAAGGRRVWVKHISNHASVASTRVLRESADQAGAARAAAHGGLLHDEDQRLLTEQRLPYPLETVAAAISSAGQQCLSEGITAVVDAGIGAGIESLSAVEVAAFQRLRAAGDLPVRAQLMPFLGALHPVSAHVDDEISIGLDLGLTGGFGDDWLSLGHVKMWFDGGMMARSAALTEPYVGTENRGQLSADPATLIEDVRRCHASGWQVAVHAIGDAAIDVAIDAFAEAQRQHPRSDARHRIEHGGLIREDQLARLGALGVTVATQPCFLWNLGDGYARVLGEERALGLYRGRSLLDAGVRLVGSSDRPLAGTPLHGIQLFTTRRTQTGRVMAAAEAITVPEAIRAYTLDAAWAAGWEQSLGSLTPGKRADFTVLEADPHTVDPDAIGSIPVLGTFIDGQERWARA